MVERLGRLSDLELWRDMRASKIEGAHCCRRARVSQPTVSGLRLASRIFFGQLSRYKRIRYENNIAYCDAAGVLGSVREDHYSL